MKCPECGFDFKYSKPTNYTYFIEQLRDKRGKACRIMIANIINIMENYQPVTQLKLYLFLKKTIDVSDAIIMHSINKYYEGNHYLTKGLEYLTGMILNFDKNKEKIMYIEEKIYGKNPPLYKDNI